MATTKKAPAKKLVKKPVAKGEGPATDELDSLLIKLSELKAQGVYINDQIKDAQGNVIEMMRAREVMQHVAKSGFKRITATIVQGKRVVIDEPGLKKRVGADMWNRITTRVLDRNKLDAYVRSGEVDPNEVAAVSEEVENAPYVKLTIR